MNYLLSTIISNKIKGINFENNVLFINEDISLNIDFDYQIDDLKINIKNANVEILELNPNYQNLSVFVDERSSLKHITIFNNLSNLNNMNLDVINYGNYERNLIDLSNNSNKINCKILLDNEGASSFYKSSVVSPYKVNKVHVINMINNKRHTKGEILNYGVSFKDSILDITGIGDIKKGASLSEAHQKTNIITLDTSSKAYARPFLYIEEDDVKASHDTAVGKINEEILFYMQSRGLSSNEAKKFVTLGYFKPIIDQINDEKIKESINEYLKEVI